MSKWDEIQGIAKLYPYLMHRDKYQCVYCGFDGSSPVGYFFLTHDHVLPMSQKRLAKKFKLKSINQKENLVTACRHCNAILNRWTAPENIRSIKKLLPLKRKAIRKRKKFLHNWWARVVKPASRLTMSQFEKKDPKALLKEFNAGTWSL